MDDVGSEIGQKMRSAIKAKLTELGCYVDDELPDYVMVMVANKRTRSQMEDDLQLFLGTNTQLFVNWLHQVLKKLQEVTVSTSLKQTEAVEPKTSKPKSSTKEHKVKEKKDKKIPKEKHKKSDGSGKKSKKETKKKEKESRKKVPKKSKKKSKNDEVIRPNVPPLLMNLEKESEPSITDVFAGQILKNHGITLEKSITADTKALEEIKPLRKALKRNRFPIIDPATVSNVTDPQPTEVIAPEPSSVPTQETVQTSANESAEVTVPDENTESAEPKATVKTATIDLQNVPREEQIREMNEIEAKIQGLKKKLADQMDSMSEDEDFLNIRTEAEELMNDFAEDVLQEIAAAQNSTPSTPPLSARLDAAPSKPAQSKPAVSKPEASKPEAEEAAEVLPHIELQLPKRPMRERLGARPEPARPDKRKSSDERLTPERPPAEERARSVRTRLGEAAEERGRKRHVDLPERATGRDDHNSKRLTSKVCSRGGVVGGGGGGERARAGPASVVRVRPRPRAAPGAPAPALLMRAVADAHKSLLNVAPKVDNEPQVKRALVLPMRRTVESQNILIQVQAERVSSQAATSRDTSDCEIDLDTESLAELTDPLDRYKSGEYVPEPIKRSVNNQRVKYVPSHTSDSSAVEDDVIKIHNPTVGKERGPQFVVTLDGLDPNVFLAKKLRTEGLDDQVTPHPKRLNREASKEDTPAGQNTAPAEKAKDAVEPTTPEPTVDKAKDAILKKSKDEGKVTVKIEEPSKNPDQRVDLAFGNESRTSPEAKRKSSEASADDKRDSPPAKRRRASPIVFDVRERQREAQERRKETRERKESAGSDVTVTTVATTAVAAAAANNKYDSLPSLPSEKRRLPCRVFPACRFGAACAFSHPRCKFASACSRRDCVYSHPTALTPAVKATPALASHVVPVGNYKTISPAALPTVCRFYPACANPGCPYVHPKPCRYGRACLNKHECNFYHHEAATKWRSPFQV